MMVFFGLDDVEDGGDGDDPDDDMNQRVLGQMST